MRALGRPLLSVLAGALLWTAFPPLSWWPAAIVGIAAFTLVCRGAGLRTVALLGWLAGLGCFVPTLTFLRGLGVDAWLVPAAVEALWFVPLAVAVAVVSRHRGWAPAVALLWVAQEAARDRWPLGGFPWARVGFGQVHGPLLPLAAVGGAPLLTAVAALLGTLLAWLALATVRRRRRLLAAAVTAASWGAALGGAAAVALPVAGTTAGGAPAVVVAAIQGNVPRLGLGEFAQKYAVTRDHELQTERLAADVAAGRRPRPDLVIWPENSVDIDPLRDPTSRAMVDRAVRAIGVPVVVGAVLAGPGPRQALNSAIVWSPETGPGARYVKQHLVPFGEYLPLRGLLTRLVGRFTLIPDDFVPGHAAGTLATGPATIADVICFEVADDAVVRSAVTGGGRLLAVQTNNATYERPGDDGRGGETAQQLDMARLRAVEHGRAVVVAATSGVSALVAPDGRLLARTGVFTPATLEARLPLRDPRTLSDRLAVWPELAASVAGLVWLGAALVLGLRRRPGAAPVRVAPDADAPVPATTP